MQTMVGNLKKILMIVGIAIFLLICRIAYIQLIGGEELAAATRMQSLISLEGSNTRGIIYDRNGSPLVADKKRYIYIIKDNRFNVASEAILGKLGAEPVNNQGNGYRVYSSEGYNKNLGKDLIRKSGAYILQASSRYSDDQIAAHLIGYVNKQDDSGAAGLELMYDEQLTEFNRHMYAVADVKGNILPGRGLIITTDSDNDSYVKEGIQITVDKGIQKAVETIIESSDDDCAVAVLDSKSGGVVAMACTPKFDPGDIEKHLKSHDDELINKVTQGEYAPGSVFKIVVAAAALEEGIDMNKTIDCKGFVRIGDTSVKCDTGGEEGHGVIGMQDAFAQSCNSFFIELGEETGAENIIDMADKMGLGKRVIDGYPQESKGRLMDEEESTGGGIGNLSIGQGETLVTPIQVACMTNIIAAGGIDRGIHIKEDDESGEERIISQKTADSLMDMMGEVSLSGTGKMLGLYDGNGYAEAAVKTGTAEYETDGGKDTHGWITGYTPCDEPEYVISVFVEGGVSGTSAAGPIFKKIVDFLKESGNYSRPTLA